MNLNVELVASPTLYPLAYDPRAEMVLLTPVTESAYEAASFLDLRMIPSGGQGEWKPWSEIVEAARELPERCHFIFHISHVGSTLLARLLGHHRAFFALREPVVLRKFAEIDLTIGNPDSAWSRPEFLNRLGVFLGLWSRTFRPEQTSLIKATSIVSEMSSALMERVSGSRSIFMFVPPETFLKSLLGGAMSDITTHAARRLARLQRRIGITRWQLAELSPGESVAMSWLCEMLALHETARRFPERVIWINFDQMLANPERSLTTALEHLGASDAAAVAPGILAGPTMRQYAKAPSQAFDARFRDQLLAQAASQHETEIRKGLDWLDRAAAEFPLIQAVMSSQVVG